VSLQRLLCDSVTIIFAVVILCRQQAELVSAREQHHAVSLPFAGHIVFSCVVFWLCNPLFGLIAFILAGELICVTVTVFGCQTTVIRDRPAQQNIVAVCVTIARRYSGGPVIRNVASSTAKVHAFVLHLSAINSTKTDSLANTVRVSLRRDRMVL